MMTEVQFVQTFSVFVFFLIFITYIGGPSFISPEAKAKIQAITVPTQKGKWDSVPVIGPIVGFFKMVYDGLSIFYLLLSFSSPIAWVTLIIVIPYTITLFYVILKLVRGTS